MKYIWSIFRVKDGVHQLKSQLDIKSAYNDYTHTQTHNDDDHHHGNDPDDIEKKHFY